MTYARIVNGIVTKILTDMTVEKIFFRPKCKFLLHKRIDLLEVQPDVGWVYDEETGFSEE